MPATKENGISTVYRFASRRIATLAMVAGLIAYAHSAAAAWWWPFGDDGLHYHIDITGIDEEMQEWLHTLKLDMPTQDNPPQTPSDLPGEAAALENRLDKALDAKGYYDAIIHQHVDLDASPPVLHYEIMPGKRYRLRSVELEWQDAPLKSFDTAQLASRPGDPVDAPRIEQDAQALTQAIGDKTCLLSLKVTPLLRLYGNDAEAELVFRIKHGPQANFGPAVVTGNQDVKDEVILRSVAWKQGECYGQDKIEKTRTALVSNQLLASVRLITPDTPDANGEVPVTIEVTERVPRTIRAGANYSTAEGFGITLGWEHRNFFGGAEKFTTDLSVAQQKQALLTALRIPAFIHPDIILALTNGIKREDTDAYRSYSIDMGAMLEYRWTPKINSGAGIAYTLTRSEDVRTGKSNFGLLSTPAFIERDTRDNALDARRGHRMRLDVTPYIETFGDGSPFLRTQFSAQTYISRDIALKPTLALRFATGSISGANGRDIPSDLRFYAGGGGSVRGYGYQKLGPRFNGEPIGGLSYMEGTAEVRTRFTDTLGAAAFVDAGNAYASSLPKFNEKLYFGAGLGMRYYSPAGPLRLDVAFPLNGKDIGQTGYGLYVSLGQAF